MKDVLPSFVSSAGRVLATGGSLVDRDEYQRRLEVCGGCDQNDTSRGGIVCALCGCNMKIKARFRGVDCPLAERGGVEGSKWSWRRPQA